MIELIQNTGIQFIEIPLFIEEDENLSTEKSFAEKIVYDSNGKEESGEILFPYKWEDKYIDFDSINAEAIDKYGDVLVDEIRPDFVRIIDKSDIYKVRGREALDIYSNHWLPIPYFRTRNDVAKPFHSGPEDWCRMWVGEVDRETQLKEKCTHKIILAFDTSTSTASEQGENYLKPNDTDATSSGNIRFKCVIKERFFSKFYSREAIDIWLDNIYQLKPKKSKNFFRHFANYFVLLDVLNKENGFPEIALLPEDRSIDVGLVLDIGNSRTCGLLVETTSPKSDYRFDFTAAKKIEIRDLSLPYKVYNEPFEMQIAFAEERFGNEATAYLDNVFQWPSLLRVGKEAVRLTSIFESEDSQATMSSPKRYLWDDFETNIPWIKVDKDGYMGYNQSKDLRKSALYGIAEHLNSDGTLNNFGIGATESNYSRKSLMTFAMVEIILQALSQINSFKFRKDLGNSSFKRILKDIVITCPTAMTKREHENLMSSLDDAIALIRKYEHSTLHKNLKVHPSENTNNLSFEEEDFWKYDEATCSQIAYLYSELVDKFKGKHELFFKYRGKVRENSLYSNQASVTIASVDIGGGTSDLMICNYQADPESEIAVIKPKPLFWEGFNIAGDDIIKRIIEFVILPSIERYLKEKGGTQVDETLNYLFGRNAGNQVATQRIYRRQFANQIATYCAYDAINHLMKNNYDEKKSVREIFKNFPKPKNNLIPYLEKIIKEKCNLKEFDFLDIYIQYDLNLMNYAISDVIKPAIDQLIKLIAVFDVDILLLSGKSSNLKVIQELFKKSLVLSPDKIIAFGDYRFGDWYPFATFGEVKDPKTTVSVGALIAFLSSIHKLEKFKIELNPLKEIQSTAEYIGVMNDDFSKIYNEKIIFPKNKIEGKFKFFGSPISIGMRQLAAEEWISTPLYVFGFKNDEQKELLNNEDIEYPLIISITRNDENLEEILFDDILITDKNGNDVDESFFKLVFKTSINQDGYWKENGSFLLKNYTDE